MDDSKKAGTTRGRDRRQARVTEGPDGAAEVARAAAAPVPTPPDAAEEPLLDPRDAATQARLRERTATGGYAVPETSVVRAIRGWKRRGDAANVRTLCGLLIERCM